MMNEPVQHSTALLEARNQRPYQGGVVLFVQEIDRVRYCVSDLQKAGFSGVGEVWDITQVV